RRLADAHGAAVVKEINESNQGAIRQQMDDIDACAPRAACSPGATRSGTWRPAPVSPTRAI
ncbi:hypothetical protein, partial [Actinomadura sp. NPDC000929]|uniref:hypothetical protein n=1 Tax=Actinomadura sp. NPDC000929 TaxID=3154517 RepID=UPI00339AED4E